MPFWNGRLRSTPNHKVIVRIIVEQKPADTKITIVGGNKVYTTRAGAEKEMTVVCKK